MAKSRRHAKKAVPTWSQSSQTSKSEQSHPTSQVSQRQTHAVQSPYGSGARQQMPDTAKQRRKQLQKELANAQNQAKKAEAERDMQSAAQSHSVMDMLEAGFRHGQANDRLEREAKQHDGESFGSGFKQVVLPEVQKKVLAELNRYIDGMDDGQSMDGPGVEY